MDVNGTQCSEIFNLPTQQSQMTRKFAKKFKFTFVSAKTKHNKKTVSAKTKHNKLENGIGTGDN